jgi:hypothetical protein
VMRSSYNCLPVLGLNNGVKNGITAAYVCVWAVMVVCILYAYFAVFSHHGTPIR